MNEIVLDNYPRLEFAVKNKIPISLAIHAKEATTKSLGKYYVENDEYWEWKKNLKIFNVYELMENESLEQILQDYQVDLNELIMAYYEKKGLDDELRRFMLDIWDRPMDDGEMNQQLSSWKLSNETTMKTVSQIKKKVEENQNWLSSQKKTVDFKTSPIKITSIELEGKVMMSVVVGDKKVKRYPIETKNGFDVFINSFTSYKVPFLSYKGTDEVFIKVYDGDMDISLDKIKPSDVDIEEENTINAVVFTDDETNRKITVDSYIHMKMNLKDNRIQFQTKNISEEKPIAATRLEEHLPIHIEQLTEKNVFGEYYIYGLQLNLSLFLEMIMLDKHARELIYMDESSSFLSTKKKLMFRLRQPNIRFEENEIWDKYFSFLIHQEEVSKGEIKPFINYHHSNQEIGSIGLEPRISYLKVIVNKSKNREMLQMGLLMFTNLLGIFKQKERLLREGLVKNGIKFRESKKWNLKEVDKNMVNVDKEKYIEDLNGAAPHIFVTNYAADVCQVHDQPVIIPPHLVKQWNKEHKEAVPFPPPRPFGKKGGKEEIFLGCGIKNPKKEYVNIKEHNLSNKGEYPYLPCCTSKNMQEPGSHSLFTHYYLGEEYSNNEAITTSVIKSRKLLRKGQDGVLNPIIPTTFKLLGLLKEEETLWRFGVSFSAFSAIRCLLYVTEDKTFMKYFERKEFGLKEEEEIDRYIFSLLKNRKIQPSLLSQELYGMEEEEIADYLKELDFLDTKELVRWLEEYFNLHLFVFDLPVDGQVNLEIPRHKMFHVRNDLHRPCVVLFRHWGSKPEEIDYPQYELILKENSKKERTMVWPKEASTKFLELANQLQETYQVSSSLNSKEKIIRKNPYSILNYDEIFEHIQSQYIDDAGKLRGVTIKIGKKDDDRMTIYLPPSQPLNYPREEDEYNVDIDTALNYFEGNTITSFSKEGDMITGLWFKILDIPEGVYIPLIPLSVEDFREQVDNDEDIQEGRPNPVFSFENSLMAEYHNLNKMRSVYLHTIFWAYTIFMKETGRGREDFFRKYFTLENFDPAEDLEDINTTLPSTNRISTAIRYLEKHFPFVKQGKILCLNEEMKEKIEYFVTISEERMLTQPEVKREDMLTSLFTTAEDLPVFESNQNFISLANFKQWLFNEKGDKMEIVDKMDVSMAAIKNPFIYKQKQSNHLYIIQNVSLGQEERAVHNQLVYQKEEVNLGYYTPALPKENVTKDIYIISPSGDVHFFTTKEGGQETVLLLDYGDHIYASLIQIV